jgi:hypothetical protein
MKQTKNKKRILAGRRTLNFESEGGGEEEFTATQTVKHY